MSGEQEDTTYFKSLGTVTVYEPEPTHVDDDDEEPEDTDRNKWGSKIEYVLSIVSYAVGLGNIWRFSYLCERNGGGAFLIPYIIMALVEGLPIFYLELLIGQSVRRGAVGVWRILNPRMSGIGYASAVVSFLVGIYYNVLITWCLWYFGRSFSFPLPWSNGTACGERQCAGFGPSNTSIKEVGLVPVAGAGGAAEKSCSRTPQKLLTEIDDVDPAKSIEWPTGSVPPPGAANLTYYSWREAAPECAAGSRTQYFFYRRTLDITESIEDVGSFNLNLFLFLTLAWGIIYVCLVRGIKSTGKVVYFTALFPYAVMIIFFVRAVTLNGFQHGLYYLYFPKFEKLLEPQVWLDAACQIFFSFGLAFGGIIAMASYNPRKNNCRRDAICVTICNCATGLFAASIIFSILGNKAYETAGTCLSEKVKEKLPFVISPYYESWRNDIMGGFIGADNKSFNVGGYRTEWEKFVIDIEKEFNATKPNSTNTSASLAWNSPSHVLSFLRITFTNTTSMMFTVATNATLLANASAATKDFWSKNNYKFDLEFCDLNADLQKAGSGTGLAFIAFTEAIDRFWFPPLWSVLFFLMLLALGVGSEFGTLIGVLTCFEDVIESRAEHKGKWYTAKWFVAGMISLVSYIVGILFVFGNGFYFVDVFDLFGATFPLLLIALFECLAVMFYAAKLKERTPKELLTSGIEKLRYWHKYIYDEELSIIWTIGWYLAPVVLVLVFLATVVQRVIQPFEYKSYNRTLGTLNQKAIRYPLWVLPVGLALTCLSIVFLPFMFFYYKKYPWIGRASRSRSREATRVSSEAPVGIYSSGSAGAGSSQPHASNDAIQQSTQSLGSILLNRLGTKSSGESPSENNTSERNKQPVSFKDDHDHQSAAARNNKATPNGSSEQDALLKSQPLATDENPRHRHHSGSTSEKTAHK